MTGPTTRTEHIERIHMFDPSRARKECNTYKRSMRSTPTKTHPAPQTTPLPRASASRTRDPGRRTAQPRSRGVGAVLPLPGSSRAAFPLVSRMFRRASNKIANNEGGFRPIPGRSHR